MMLNLLSCLLLSTIIVSTCFMFSYLVFWLYEITTGKSADFNIFITYIILIIIIAIILMGM